MKTKWKVIEAAVVGLLVLIQFVPVRRDNPPVTSDVQAPEDVKAILDISCYDCHSHRTRWPWYSRVAPVSWLIAGDVREGRARMNLSQWDGYPDSSKEFFKTDIYKQVAEGEMPPAAYRLVHSKARVSPAALNVLKRWSGAQGEGVTALKP